MGRLVPGIFLIASLVVSMQVFAQREGMTVQYMYNKMMYNPAATGLETGYITSTGMFGSLTADYNQPGYGMFSSNMLGGSLEGAIAPKKLGHGCYIGIGVSYQSNFNLDYLNHSFTVSGAYSFPIKGTKGGILSIGFNASRRDVQALPVTYTIVEMTAQELNSHFFDAGLGLYYHNDKFYAGFSALHLTNANLDVTDIDIQTEEKVYLHYPIGTFYGLVAGYTQDIMPTRELQIAYSLFACNERQHYYVSGGLLRASALLMYKQRFSAGLSFGSDGWYTLAALMAGLVVAKSPRVQAQINYSYNLDCDYFDHLYTMPSHELIVKLKIKTGKNG